MGRVPFHANAQLLEGTEIVYHYGTGYEGRNPSALDLTNRPRTREVFYTDGAISGKIASCGIWSTYGHEASERLPGFTTNEAEWRGLLLALKIAVAEELPNVEVRMDSLLVVRQFHGHCGTFSEPLQKLKDRAYWLASKLPEFRLGWIPREHNKFADMIANRVLEGLRPEHRRKSPNYYKKFRKHLFATMKRDWNQRNSTLQRVQ